MEQTSERLSVLIKDEISKEMRQVALLDDRLPESVKVMVRYGEMLVTVNVPVGHLSDKAAKGGRDHGS